MSTTYNGWTNYETWRVNLELVEGLTYADLGFSDRDAVDHDIVERVGHAVEMFCCDYVEEYSSGFALSLAHDFLARVDWEEIAQHIVDEVRMELSAT